ncbi:MAG: hypothetical protein ACI82G_001566 [Bradymonadia bacterium]|jgi:hypothetical protein
MRQIGSSGWVAVWLLGAFAGCSGNAVAPATNVVDSYTRAVERADWPAAYALLGREAHGGVSEQEYVTFCQANQAALQQQARDIAAARRARGVTTSAELPIDGARTLSLVHQEGGWRLNEQVPLPLGSDTPVAALASLASVADSDAFSALLSGFDDALADRYLAELRVLARLFEDGSRADVQVHGDSATVTIDQVTLQMTRTDGSWRVTSIDSVGYYNDYDPY